MAEKSFLRQVTKSLAGGLIPGDVEDPKSPAGVVEDSLARVLAGLKSQVMSRDPETGELYLGGWQSLKDDWNGVPYAERKRKARPGIVDETMSLPALYPALVGLKAKYLDRKSPEAVDQAVMDSAESVPDWAFEAADRADAMHQASRDEAGLSESKGFRQNAAEGLGVMLGQVPIPISRAKAVLPTTARKGIMSTLKKTVGSAPEWFSPTIDPSMANYMSGAGFGGALGAYQDYSEEKENEEAENAEFSKNIRPMIRYYTKNGEFPGFPRQSQYLPALQYADGGKVSALRQALYAIRMDPKAKIGSKRAIDPLSELKGSIAASHTPSEASVHENWLETVKDLPQLSEEDVDKLLALHDRIMKRAPVQKYRGGQINYLGD